MVNWLFNKPGARGAALEAPPAPRGVPAKTGPTPQQKAEAKARQLEDARGEWTPRLQAAQGDDAALLRIAQEAPLVETKLAAVQALASEEALKQAEREFRNHDRRVHRAAKQRLDAALKQRESRAHAATILDAGRALAAEPLIAANRLVALDRAWESLDAQILEPRQRSEFAELRERLNAAVHERGEQERQVQRWIAEARLALAELQRACTLPGGDADAQTLSQACATAQALLESRIDIATNAALDQALQAALQGAEQTRARWAEPAPPVEPEAAALESAVAPPVVRPAPPRTLDGAQRQALDVLLQAAESALAEGRLGAMQEQLEAIDALFDTFHGIRPSDALHARIQALYAERGRLKGWQDWGGSRARDDLVNEAEELARFTLAASPRLEASAAPPPAAPDGTGAPLEVEAAPAGPAPARQPGAPKLRLKVHAEAIQDLWRRWKELDRLGAPANQALWKRFDAALHTAHEPVAAQLAALKAQRQANLAAREALLTELDALPAQPASEGGEVSGEALAAFWKDQARALENFQRGWRPLGPLEHTVPSAARNALQQRLTSSVARIEAPLQAARSAAEGVRQRLIELALALVEELKQQPQLRDAIPRVRDLQMQWQQSAKSLTLPRGVESALWNRFKGATDAVFTQRDAAANARDAELTANLAAREALLHRLEGLSSATPKAEIERTLAEVDRAWRIAGEPPRGTLARLEARLQEAHAAALRALSASDQVTWAATCERLAAQLTLCEEREAAAGPLEDIGLRWAAQLALPVKLPAAWDQALTQRWLERADAGAPADSKFEEVLLQLEATLDLPASAQQMAARRALKLRALKDTLEGRGPASIDAAKRASWLSTALRQRCGDAALRERLHTLIAALRAAPPGTLLPTPAGVERLRVFR